jgi:ABC-type glycerol-3-phosphate transport system substrate-binding protein
MKKFIIISLLLLPLLTGCFQLEQKTAILWTNIPEVAAYVELFNASQTNYRVELMFAEQPADYQKLVSDSAPDIVISENLASGSIISAFTPLNKLIENEKFAPSVLYQDLYNLGCRENIPYVLPLSFNIPAIMFKQDSLSDNVSGIILSPEQLKIEAEAFNKLSTDKFRVKGFAPSWTPEFMLYNAFISGSSFSETKDGSLIWNDANLTASVEFCRDWTENVNAGFQEENDFTLTYCYDPGYKLLNSGRIGYYFTTLREFFTIPANDRSTLEFKWLGSNSSIPVSEDIVFIGIPSKSRKKKTSEEFLLWFLREDTQKTLIESSQFKRMRNFGICGGFSSIQSVNELVMPAYYRRLIGNIPPEQYLDFPANLPSSWKSIRSDVIIPWLKDRASIKPETGDLAGVLKTWTLQEQKR